jgi:hypothetical protein
MRQYREADADNARWEGFQFRPGDIVIDAPSKSGTTWTQLLVALLIFDGPEFPRRLGEISLWMEHLTRPRSEVHTLFESQSHRRFIKSHTPLDGIPMTDEVRYVCVGRDPRDAAVSMIHHVANLDKQKLAELMGTSEQDEPQEEAAEPVGMTEYFDRWIEGDDFPGWNVRFLAHHYQTFWDRRDDANVALFHFDDYLDDLPGQLIRLARHLQVEISADRASVLADEASLSAARARAPETAPQSHLGIFKDPSKFFRSGTRGEGIDLMTSDQRLRYRALVAQLLSPDLDQWIHRGR